MANLEITDMIEQCTHPRKIEILLRLRELNKYAYKHMKQPRATWKTKYRSLQKTKEWREARSLLKEYHLIDTTFTCVHCGVPLESFILHHETYNPINLFTPPFVEILCITCHRRVHSK